jgi:L-fucose mutarotase
VLKNIDALLNADLLGHLAAMGHGDVLALVDRNYPAAAMAQRLVTLSGVDVTTAARAILSVLPVDTFVEPAVLRMGAVGDETPSSPCTPTCTPWSTRRRAGRRPPRPSSA